MFGFPNVMFGKWLQWNVRLVERLNGEKLGTGMDEIRKYGKQPYSIAVIHGGPGAPGGMAYLAQRLSERFGVIEPFQTSKTIQGQIKELHSVIRDNCQRSPVRLIGHSWGAWLAYIFTAEFPTMVNKLVLIGAGAFEEKYNADSMKIRLDRLSANEKIEALRLTKLMNKARSGNEDPSAFHKFGELMSKADSFDCFTTNEEIFDFQPDVYRSIWPEAEKMRKDGKLLRLGKKIKCPVIAIHGDYDPHPATGVKEPLSRVLSEFKFICLEDCGHYPWKEKNASRKFFDVLYKELS